MRSINAAIIIIIVEQVSQLKFLGTIISDNLKWITIVLAPFLRCSSACTFCANSRNLDYDRKF